VKNVRYKKEREEINRIFACTKDELNKARSSSSDRSIGKPPARSGCSAAVTRLHRKGRGKFRWKGSFLGRQSINREGRARCGKRDLEA